MSLHIKDTETGMSKKFRKTPFFASSPCSRDETTVIWVEIEVSKYRRHMPIIPG